MRELQYSPEEEEPSSGFSIFKLITPWLVLFHTSLYMIIYYGNSPTSADYSDALDVPDNILGLLKAITPLAAFVSTFMYNAILGRTYTIAYIVSFFFLTFGCLSYFLAKTFESVALIMLGRTMIGLGGGRVITRMYYAVSVPESQREFWASLLVASTALSITFGPGLSSMLEYVPA